MKLIKVSSFAALTLAATVALTGCTASNTESSTASPSTAPSTSSAVATATKGDSNNYNSTADLTVAPKLTVDKLGNVSDLLIKDVVAGTGAEVKPTDTVTVQYTGIGAISGKEFDSSWTNGGQPVSFQLNQVIPGWTQGLTGMKVGGRRILVIPASLAYGDQSPTPAIGNGESLVFVVDMISNTAPTK